MPDSLPVAAMEESRSVEMARRLNHIAFAGASTITMLVLASLWGEWHRMLVVALFQLPLLPLNWLMTSVLLARWGTVRAETTRAAVNLGVAVAIGHVAHWPLPTWLWLPFVAIAFDHLGPRVARRILVVFCLAWDVGALLDGVPWIYPVSFTLFAVFCSEMTRHAGAHVRDMLAESDLQRSALAEAHGAVQEAHTRMTAEVAARESIELELRQSQKLEAIGRLAAGIAHEINTPIQFVGDSISFVQEAVVDLAHVIVGYRAGATTAARATAEADVDVAYVLAELPKAIDRSRDGLDRVAAIVRSVKAFSHPDRREMNLIDVDELVQDALTLAGHDVKLVADVETHFGAPPRVTGHQGELNQVLVNIIVNAAHAIGDVVEGTDRRGRITVRTRTDGDRVEVVIADTGAGIPATLRERVFEPFFTTKEIGRGTGQGLAIARTVVQRHGGTLTFESAPGEGTTFVVQLPAAHASVLPKAA